MQAEERTMTTTTQCNRDEEETTISRRKRPKQRQPHVRVKPSLAELRQRYRAKLEANVIASVSTPDPDDVEASEIRARIQRRKALAEGTAVDNRVIEVNAGRDDGQTDSPQFHTLKELAEWTSRQRASQGGTGNDTVPEQAGSVSIGERRPSLALIREKFRSRPAATTAEQPSYQQTELQKATAEWLGEVNWNLAMTLTFRGKRGTSHALATSLYGRFLPRLREIVGRNGARNYRIPMAPIIEGSNEQLRERGVVGTDGREATHIHVLLRVRGDDPLKYKDAIASAWRATNRRCGDPKVSCPNSDKWYLPLRDSEARERMTGYFLKHQAADTLGLLVPYVHLD